MMIFDISSWFQNVNKTHGHWMFSWGYADDTNFMIWVDDFKLLIKPTEFKWFLMEKDFGYDFMISKCL